MKMKMSNKKKYHIRWDGIYTCDDPAICQILDGFSYGVEDGICNVLLQDKYDLALDGREIVGIKMYSTGFYIDGVRVPVTRTNPPKFSNTHGRTWDGMSIKVGDDAVMAYLDTTWGRQVYFRWPNNALGAWRKLCMLSTPEQDAKGKTWDFDPMDPTNRHIELEHKPIGRLCAGKIPS